MTNHVAGRQTVSIILVLTVIAVLAAGCAASVQEPRASLVGKPAPEFRVEEVSGRPVTLDDFRAKASVVLVFYHSYG